MKAWQSPETPGIGALRLVDVERPAPSASEVLVKVRAAALNFSDLLMIDGVYQIRPDRPFTPGQEIAGTVVEAGSETGFGPGCRVAGKVPWGGFAEYAVLRSDMAIRLPDETGFATAAALPVAYTTAFVALVEDAAIRETYTVLIHAAAGGVGLAAVQIANAYGAKIVAAATGSRKCDLVRSQGADVVVDYETGDFAAAANEATAGRGVDVVLDTVGGEITRRSLRCLARKGQLLITGFSSGTIPEIPANRLLLKRAVARGVYWDHDRDPEMVARCTRSLMDLIRADRIAPVVRDHYEPNDLPRALEDLKSGRSTGKLVLNADRKRPSGR